MTRDIRIALLIGLAFITLFGMVLGQRSLRLSHAAETGQPLSAAPQNRPGPEVAAIAVLHGDDRPVLSPPRPAAPAVRHEPAPPRRVASAGPPAWDDIETLEVGYAPDRPPGERIAPIMVAESGPARSTPAVRVEFVSGTDPAPASALSRTYRVQPGDSLRKIARKVYGPDHEDQYVLIYQANKGKLRDAHTVIVGDVLTIPPSAGYGGPAAGSPGASPPAPRGPYAEASIGELGEAIRRALPRAAPREIVVKRGDHLARIAEREMGVGSAANVRKLIEANKARLNDPNRLVPGMKLRLPQ